MLKKLTRNYGIDNRKFEYAIIGSFARSFDTSHIEKNRIHLISSIFLLEGNDLVKVNEFISKFKSEEYDKILYVFIVFPQVSELNVSDLGSVVVIRCNINDIFKYLMFNEKSEGLFNNIFGDLNLDRKDFDSILQQSIFIFRNQMWSNVVLNFKLNKIDVSGGSISKRHILHTVELRLVLFLINVLDTTELFFYIYKNFKNPILSPSIPLEFYNRILNTDFLKIKGTDDITSNVFNVPSIYDSKELLEGESFVDIIKHNIVYGMTMLKNDIINGIKTELDKLKKKMDRYSSDLSSLEYKLAGIENINNVDTRGMRNKEKKRFKKERTALLSEGISSKIDDLNYSISQLKYDIENIQEKISKKESELKQFTENSKEYTISELIKLQTKYSIINNYNFKKTKVGNGRISNRREYHSLSGRRYNSTNNSIKKINFNFNSPIFIELQRILNNSPLDNNTQLKIEKYLYNQGGILLKNRLDEQTDINYYKLNFKILEYFKNSVEELGVLIDNYRANIIGYNSKQNNSVEVEFKIISALDNETIISQLLGRLLRIISNNNLNNHNTNCTELAFDLGQSLLYSYYSLKYQNYLKDKPDINEYGLSQFINNYYLSFNQSVTDIILIQIGLKLLNFLEEVNLIHSETYFKEKDKKNHVFVANEKILNDIGKSLDLLSISYKIPMIVPPKPYKREKSKDILGGFLLNDIEYTMPLIIKNSELKVQSIINDDNIIFDTVNNLSSVGYKINTDLLEFILDKGIEYDLITDPDFKHPLEIKKNNHKKLTISENKNLEGYLSKKQLEMNILGLALIFKNVPEFYIPVRIDNRGRIYCMVDYLNYQGIELAKSLLLFSKGEKINKCDKQSIDYLKIFGANCFGNGIDKKSYNERVEWVNNNKEDILNFRNGNLIKKADSKLLFIAFCFEYINYHNSLFSNETSYISHFPIQLDATCNGYQHLSLLTGDEPLAGQLNLISGDKNTKPNDFYDYVALKINDYLISQIAEEKLKLNSLEKKESNLNISSNKVVPVIDSYERLLKLNKNRSLVKLPIMVKAYNASKLTIIDYLKEKFDKVFVNSKNNKDFLDSMNNIINNEDKVIFLDPTNKKTMLNNKDFVLLVNILEKVISNEFPKLNEFSLYLNEIAKICVNLNITISWPLPSGLNVNQYYVDSEAIRLKPFKFRKKTFSIKVLSDKVNKRKQIRALMPNLIHSLDAASLCLLINMFYQDKNNLSKKLNFFAIHDCFAVTANNVTTLIKFIKLVYIKIYSEDSYLETFDKGIINIIKLQYGNESFDDKNKIITVNGNTFKYPDVNQVIKGKIKACQIKKAVYPIT